MTETITDDKHYVFMTGTIYLKFLQIEEKKKSNTRLQAV
jgi:hypothetical protein